MLFPYVYIDSLVCLKSSSSICLFFPSDHWSVPGVSGERAGGGGVKAHP